jgi:hypothetical protein
MKRPTRILIAAAPALLLFAEVTRAQSTGPLEGYNAFRLVRTRFIFDPERQATRSEAAVPRAQSAPSRSNFIAVTGTMVTPGRTLAFFSGSQPEYSKVISVGETIADFKITSITPAQVELERAGQPIIVPVGRQLPLDGSTTAVAPTSLAPAPDISGTPAANSSAPSAAASTSDKSEILRRMMERRQKEVSK